ncbi:MAG: biopolymer transporter ExbD [Endomicrobium sp.]|jgi:biopolymer transport protein ExbD|nr:biopolymer transporter ExbD [Endomicrobium sp.]
MSKCIRNRISIKSDINITPFTDVVLVLLIIFIISMPALQQSIDVNVSKTIISNNTENSSVEILILENGNICIDGEKVIDSNIENIVRNLIISSPDKSVVIKSEENVPYDSIIQFIDKAKKVGVSKFALAQ